MTARDLLTDDEKRVLASAYASAVDVNKLVQKYVDNGLNYTEHLQKSIEQLDFLTKICDMHGIER